MTNPLEHFEAGRLTDAVGSATEHVKAKPGDLSARWVLAEMLCFTGELDRADKHLDLISTQFPKAVTTTALFRQLIRAEMARRQVFQEGRVPEFLAEPSSDLQLRLAALVKIREGAEAEAADLIGRAERHAVVRAGECDGRRFSEFRDLDDLTATMLEVLTSTGKYYWVAIDSVREMEFRKPARARDFLWRQVKLVVEDGPDGEVYVPALYPGSHAATDDLLRLGRATDWTEGAGGMVRGMGQRMFLAGEEPTGVLDVTHVTFDQAGGEVR
jgi:type VI secretion system protein ImpE